MNLAQIEAKVLGFEKFVGTVAKEGEAALKTFGGLVPASITAPATNILEAAKAASAIAETVTEDAGNALGVTSQATPATSATPADAASAAEQDPAKAAKNAKAKDLLNQLLDLFN